MAQVLVCDECSEPFEKPFLQISYGSTVEHFHSECMVWQELWGKLTNASGLTDSGNHLDIMVLFPEPKE